MKPYRELEYETLDAGKLETHQSGKKCMIASQDK